MKFCEILKKLRRNGKMTQNNLAKKLSIAQSVVSDWESGEKYPQFEYLIRLADIFEISLDKLMGREISAPAMNICELAVSQFKQHLSIEDLRNELEISPDEFSKIIGISKSTLANWEKKGLPNIDKYIRIFECLNLTLEQIKELK